MDQQFFEDDFSQPVKSLIRKFSDYSDEDLTKIITRYINYEPEAVRAALYQSVEKGLVSYDLKELLWNQIMENTGPFKRNIQTFTWEKNNAFIKYFSSFTDDKIYDLIEDPDERVLDVYHALFSVAKERELISENDFQNYYNDVKSGKRTGAFENLIRIGDPDGEYPSESEMEAERRKFWKCPECNQLVEMEFDACWNCQAEIPVVVEHPAKVEIINEKLSEGTGSIIKSGFYLTGAGLLIILYEVSHPYLTDFVRHTHLIGIIFGGFFAAIGLAIVVYGIFCDKK